MRRVALALLVLLACVAGAAHATPARLRESVRHVVVIFLENHSFDSLYGRMPGVDGVKRSVLQVDAAGRPLATLPQTPGTRFPPDLPNAPFVLDRFYSMRDVVPNPNHGYYQNLIMLNGRPAANGGFGGYRMDRFPTFSGATPMGGWQSDRLPLYAYARKYTVLDRFFAGHIGPSLPGHIWLIAGATMVWKNAPAKLVYRPTYTKGVLTDVEPRNQAAFVTPDGYVVDDAQPFNPPYEKGTPDDERVPVQTLPTIGDRLSARGIEWAWYAEGWNDAVAGHPAPTFQFHHQPFDFFAPYAPGQPGRRHLKDLDDFTRAVKVGALPAVSFVKPLGLTNEHPGYSTVWAAEQQVVGLLRLIEQSKAWRNTVVFVTYDDFGGYYDHVPPPTADRWGPGVRLPCLVISPLVRRGHVDHHTYEMTSLLRFIEWRWGLSPKIGTRKAAVPLTMFAP